MLTQDKKEEDKNEHNRNSEGSILVCDPDPVLLTLRMVKTSITDQTRLSKTKGQDETSIIGQENGSTKVGPLERLKCTLDR